MKKIIISLDPSAGRNTGVCIGSIESNRLSIIKHFTHIFCHTEDASTESNQETESVESLKSTKLMLLEIIAEYSPTVLVMERSMGFGLTFVRAKLSEQTGVIKLTAHESGMSIEEISAKSVKKLVTGSGKAKKAEVIKHVCSLYGLTKKNISSDHEADALAVLYAYYLKFGITV